MSFSLLFFGCYAAYMHCSGIAASFGLYLLYQFRVLERQMGSQKFGSNILCIITLSSFYMLCLCQLWSKKYRTFDTSGGYMLFGFLLFHYHRKYACSLVYSILTLSSPRNTRFYSSATAQCVYYFQCESIR